MIRIIGTGKNMPKDENIITNEEVFQVTERKSPEWIVKHLGIHQRYFFADVDKETGKPTEKVKEPRIAGRAAEKALEDAGLTPDEVDRLIFVSCTQNADRNLHFGLEAMEIHEYLGLESEAVAKELDAGCGGFIFAVNETVKMLQGSDDTTSLIVAANITSNHFNQPVYGQTANAWLSTYIFGDGAGAMVLRQNSSENGERGIWDTYTEVDPEHPLMLYHIPEDVNSQVYEVQSAVKGTYIPYMKRAISGMAETRGIKTEELINSVDWVFAHQANGRLLDKLIEKLGLNPEKVPRNVDRYGNLATATIPILVDETDVEPGDLCLYAVVGAGAQIASALVRA